MKLEHEAGNEMFIDFTGKKLQIINKETGEIIPEEVVLILNLLANYYVHF